MGAQPKDQYLYDSIKDIYRHQMKNSAYRSGLIVKSYEKAYSQKYKSNDAFYGKKNKKEGLNRWFAEKWRNESGKIGYDKENKLYRPTKRVNDETPKTWNELSNNDINKAKKEKKIYGRVNKF